MSSTAVVFLLAPWAEALCYGFFACLFGATMYITLASPRGRQDNHSKVMVIISSIMFFLATFHLIMNCFRLVRAYVGNADSPGGPVGYMATLKAWDHVLKDTIYTTQEIFGNAVAIYRCFVIWNRRWSVIALPCCLFVVSVVSGCTVCVLFTKIDPVVSVFNEQLNHWILTFFVVAIVQNVMTTGLMAYRIWVVYRETAAYRRTGSILPISRILIESAALQLIAEIVLLALYAARNNAQYVILECVTPIIGITFGLITIRVKLFTAERTSNRENTPLQTIGSLPTQRVKVNITQDLEEMRHTDKTTV